MVVVGKGKKGACLCLSSPSLSSGFLSLPVTGAVSPPLRSIHPRFSGSPAFTVRVILSPDSRRVCHQRLISFPPPCKHSPPPVPLALARPTLSPRPADIGLLRHEGDVRPLGVDEPGEGEDERHQVRRRLLADLHALWESRAGVSCRDGERGRVPGPAYLAPSGPQASGR